MLNVSEGVPPAELFICFGSLNDELGMLPNFKLTRKTDVCHSREHCQPEADDNGQVSASLRLQKQKSMQNGEYIERPVEEMAFSRQ